MRVPTEVLTSLHLSAITLGALYGTAALAFTLTDIGPLGYSMYGASIASLLGAYLGFRLGTRSAGLAAPYRFSNGMFDALLLMFCLLFALTYDFSTAAFGGYELVVSGRSEINGYSAAFFAFLVTNHKEGRQRIYLIAMCLAVIGLLLLSANRMNALVFAVLLAFLLDLRLLTILLGAMLLAIVFVLIQISRLGYGMDMTLLIADSLTNPIHTFESGIITAKTEEQCGSDGIEALISFFSHAITIGHVPWYYAARYECSYLPGGGWSPGFFYWFLGYAGVLLWPILVFGVTRASFLRLRGNTGFLPLVLLAFCFRWTFYSPIALLKPFFLALVVLLLFRLIAAGVGAATRHPVTERS
jgi:hypothetical protein